MHVPWLRAAVVIALGVIGLASSFLIWVAGSHQYSALSTVWRTTGIDGLMAICLVALEHASIDYADDDQSAGHQPHRFCDAISLLLTHIGGKICARRLSIYYAHHHSVPMDKTVPMHHTGTPLAACRGSRKLPGLQDTISAQPGKPKLGTQHHAGLGPTRAWSRQGKLETLGVGENL
jgi:hypothetical protein